MKMTERFQRIVPIIIMIGLLGTAAIAAETDKKTDQKIEYEAGFYYTVKEGDTLWDLSQRFSDTPWQWPDLWHENEQIPNPHWIYPGERIRLFKKKEVGKNEGVQKQVIPQITPQVEAATPAVKQKPEVYYYYSQMDQVGFIRKPAVQANGVIFKVVDNKELISIDDIVYIRDPGSETISDLTPGSRWSIYRTMAPTPERKSESIVGSQHYFLGILEITHNESQYAIAKVIKSFRHIQIGDLIMPYKNRIAEVAVNDSSPGIDGKILSSEEHTELLGEQIIAFIDKGEDDNILPGQLYSIFYQETAKINGQQVALKPVDIGSLIVVHTEKTTSTVLITDVSRKITPNTRIRTP